MKFIANRYAATLALIVIAFSCKKEIHAVNPILPITFNQVFDQFWTKMSTNYVYWDTDTTDWNAVYSKYQPVFSSLNLQNVEDRKLSVGYFRDMTKGLIDNHYYISFSADGILDSTVYPAFERKQYSQTFHYPYTYSNADTNYLDDGFVKSADNNNSINGVPLIVLSGSINHDILFFSCNHFSLYKSYHSDNLNSVRPALQFFFDRLSDKSYKGVIIDVRSNEGGDISDLNFLLGSLVSRQLLFGYTQVKSNNGQFDYTPWIGSYINPSNQNDFVDRPVVVLADHASASLAETVAMAVRAMPNAKIIGETTWGATGPSTSEEVYNDGQFTVQGFMNIQTSSCKFKYIDGINYEDVGFPPDIFLKTDNDILMNGKDIQLEKAISQF